MFSLNWVLEIGRLPRRGWEEAASSNNCCLAGAGGPGPVGACASFFEAIGLVPPGLLLYMVLLRSHRTAHLYILCLLACLLAASLRHCQSQVFRIRSFFLLP